VIIRDGTAMLTLGQDAILTIGTSMMGLIGYGEVYGDGSLGAGHGTIGDVTPQILIALWPFFLIPAVAALTCLFAQRAVVFSGSKLQPKLSRISPIQTAKQKFGAAGLFEFLKSFVKLVLYSIALGAYLALKLPQMIASMSLSPEQVAAEMIGLMNGLLMIVIGVTLILGAVDLIFQHSEHRRKNRMSRQEMMDELKQSEGDPYMKQHRRQRAMAIASGKMLRDVKVAQVVIVNPTHFAVALRWSREDQGAPVCVAKGVDDLAGRIREVAARHTVPIRSDPPTARALYAEVSIGEEVPPKHYQAVAAAIRFAESLSGTGR